MLVIKAHSHLYQKQQSFRKQNKEKIDNTSVKICNACAMREKRNIAKYCEQHFQEERCLHFQTERHSWTLYMTQHGLNNE